MKFLDQAKIYIRSGDGGDGAVAFWREKFIEFGGPVGGDGGKGGDIIFKAADNLNTLIDFRYTQHFKAPKGGNGAGANRTGAYAANRIIDVPVGTQIFDQNRTTLLADLTRPGQEVTLCRGGDGGFGNAHYKSSTNRAPRRADKGWPGEERWVWLRLKLFADVGLVGYPNAGKSSLLSALSAAKPKIADYPFTTLHPALGVVTLGRARRIVLADIPGLIENASTGSGLGTRFLGHIERCWALLHLIDALEDDPITRYTQIRHELHNYGHGLDEKKELIVLTKCDCLDDEEVREKKEALEDYTQRPILPISTATHAGLEALRTAMSHLTTEDTAPTS